MKTNEKIYLWFMQKEKSSFISCLLLFVMLLGSFFVALFLSSITQPRTHRALFPVSKWTLNNHRHHNLFFWCRTLKFHFSFCLILWVHLCCHAISNPLRRRCSRRRSFFVFIVRRNVFDVLRNNKFSFWKSSVVKKKFKEKTKNHNFFFIFVMISFQIHFKFKVISVYHNNFLSPSFKIITNFNIFLFVIKSEAFKFQFMKEWELFLLWRYLLKTWISSKEKTRRMLRFGDEKIRNYWENRMCDNEAWSLKKILEKMLRNGSNFIYKCIIFNYVKIEPVQ